MKISPILLCLAFSSPLLADSSAAYAPNPFETQGGKRAPAFSEANAAAVHFLNILDNQVYGGAWQDASSLLHDVVPMKVWAEGMKQVRNKLGLVKARRVGSHVFTHMLPGGTKGEFVIIKYDTQFSNQPVAVETVTLIMEEPLGLWRVLSYHVGNR